MRFAESVGSLALEREEEIPWARRQVGMGANALTVAKPSERRAIPWERIASLTAIASLIAALAFNGLQARQAERATSESRRATELQVFTELHQLVNDSTSSISISEGAWNTRRLSSVEDRRLSEAANNVEYLAWLFESRYVQLPRAEEVWAPAIRCVYDTVTYFYPQDLVAAAFPNLKLFIQRWTCPESLR